MEVPFYRHELHRGAVEETAQQPIRALSEVVNLLDSTELQAEIERGNITVAMIRPGLDQGATNQLGTDVEIADIIEADIHHLGFLAKFSVQFDDEMFVEFYSGGPREKQLQMEPQRAGTFSSRWDEFESVLLSGPTTVLILHSPHGNAIPLWREQVGHWDIENRRDPSTIRGKFGVDNFNNLVHGSDSPESAAREVKIVSHFLHRILGE